MTPRLTTNYAKNYCNQTLIVKVILENVVTCFLLGHSGCHWSKPSHLGLYVVYMFNYVVYSYPKSLDLTL